MGFATRIEYYVYDSLTALPVTGLTTSGNYTSLKVCEDGTLGSDIRGTVTIVDDGAGNYGFTFTTSTTPVKSVKAVGVMATATNVCMPIVIGAQSLAALAGTSMLNTDSRLISIDTHTYPISGIPTNPLLTTDTRITAIDNHTVGISAIPANPLLTTDTRITAIDAHTFPISGLALQSLLSVVDGHTYGISAIPTNPLLTNDSRITAIDTHTFPISAIPTNPLLTNDTRITAIDTHTMSISAIQNLLNTVDTHTFPISAIQNIVNIIDTHTFPISAIPTNPLLTNDTRLPITGTISVSGDKMDLIDTPNSAAVTAIQNGLSKPGTPQTIINTTEISNISVTAQHLDTMIESI